MNRVRQDLFFQLLEEDFKINKQFAYHTDLSVLIIKSLLPLNTLVIANKVNYQRLIKELDLWKYYRSNSNETLKDINNINIDNYFNDRDDSIIARIIPINIANFEKEIIIEETLKNILFTSGNLLDLMENYILSLYIYYLLTGEEEIVENLKKDIINFSQEEFLKDYSKYFRYKIDGKINYSIDFEREKIELLNLLNGIESKKYKNLNEIFNKDSLNSPIKKIINNFIDGSKLTVKLPKSYRVLGDYLENLYMGKIDRSLLEIKEYILPDIFSFEEGESFYHSLLNESKVLDKIDYEDKTVVILETKIAYYKFTKTR